MRKRRGRRRKVVVVLLMMMMMYGSEGRGEITWVLSRGRELQRGYVCAVMNAGKESPP